jgi:hypothetical protein
LRSAGSFLHMSASLPRNRRVFLQMSAGSITTWLPTALCNSQSISKSVNVLFVSNPPTFTFTFTVMDCTVTSQRNKEGMKVRRAEKRFVNTVVTCRFIHMRNESVYMYSIYTEAREIHKQVQYSETHKISLYRMEWKGLKCVSRRAVLEICWSILACTTFS